ncbi:STAS domain-containing protein [Streptomyces sp. NPDC050704]|uniref:STAS domain-containing protein n=1 Tax=Streptomyces sp. NPDC050704 TaxID=3157219 RepID=UPI00342288B6
MLLPTRTFRTHCVVEFPEVVDIANAAAVRAGLNRVIADHVPPHGALIADLTGSRFVTATALSVLVETRRRLEPRGVELRAVGSAPLVCKVFSVTGLHKAIPFHRDLRDALAPAGNGNPPLAALPAPTPRRAVPSRV